MLTVSENDVVRFSVFGLRKTTMPRMRDNETMNRATLNTNNVRLWPVRFQGAVLTP